TAQIPFSDFDPFCDEFRDSPESFHDQLLHSSPGYMVMEGDVASAYVAKFDQCMQVLGNWELFSSVKPPNLPGMQRVDFFNGMPIMNYSVLPPARHAAAGSECGVFPRSRPSACRVHRQGAGRAARPPGAKQAVLRHGGRRSPAGGQGVV